MKFIVVDHDTPALKTLCNTLATVADMELVSFFRTTTRAQRYLQTHSVDLIFVEMDMQNLSGVQFVKTLVNPPLIVFTTSNNNVDTSDIKVDYADILVKPYDTKKIKHALACVRDEIATRREMMLTNCKYVNNGKFIFVKSEYKVVRINFDEVLYIESMREYVRFHLQNGDTVMSLLSIKRIGFYLPEGMFMRVHRSYIVNLNKIMCVERLRVVFENGASVPVSDQFKETFQDYIDKSFAL
ncbi:MAG: response regulator transcription factor [Alphaproteobacteria bacterium]|nr:response regulator transcription factor [Alphaproteobacteria bacterium]